MKTVYLDNNATTAVAPEVLEAMLPYLKDHYGNPSSMYGMARRVSTALNQARTQTARILGASPEEIVFTSCGTESDNAAIWAAIRSNPLKRHIITSRVEHSAVKNLCEYLSHNGYQVTFVPVDGKGRLDLDYLYDHLSEDTAVVSLMWANNETGVMFPVEEIAREVKNKGVVFHTDAVQAVGKVPMDIGRTGIDMLSLSGHKLHAPKGVGALYVRKGTKFTPFLVGGHQEQNRRGGTENVASIVALGKAAELAGNLMAEENTRVKALRDRLETGILAAVPHADVNGDTDRRLPNTTNISFEFIEGESILLMMDEIGICASSGSACTSGSLEPSHVLRAMGVPYTAAHGSVRFSLSVYNTRQEIDYVIEKLPPIIERLRQMSPFWKSVQAG
ncbi:MAG: cysteine desulfurase NifS [Desulfococcus multivorans]|nr:cysteine desulfurase NifS [Desulfococcus multivorans]MDX9820071.1 cysteine desulfurase NifS [Desulfococcus multivorans]